MTNMFGNLLNFYKFKYKQNKLENYFEKKYNMYDEYYMLPSKNINKNTKQLFQEHYNNFKPTLDEIKSLQTQDDSLSHHLTDFNVRLAKETVERESLTNFVKEDLLSLFQQPYTLESRHAFYSRITHDFPFIPKIEEYKELCSCIVEPAPLQTLYHASSYYNSIEGSNIIKGIFMKTRFMEIAHHPDNALVVELISKYLNNLTDNQLNLLLEYSINYEMFTLATLEPYMIFILGNTLFFKVFIPLHKEGNFSYLIKQAIDKQRIIRNTWKVKLYNYAKAVHRDNSLLIRPISITGIVGTSLTLIKYTISTYFHQQTPSDRERRLIDNVYSRNQGLESHTIDAIRDFASRCAYETSAFVSAVTSSFYAGALSHYEGLARSIADYLDNRQNRRP